MSFRKPFTVLSGLVLVAASLFYTFKPAPTAADRIMTFPVIGAANFGDDFNSARSGQIHGATDVFAAKGQMLVAPVDGTIVQVIYPEASWGYSVMVKDSDGYTYRYIHMNNDNPGSDDGAGGPMHAYGADMKVGNKVVRGQFVGWVGDSGNAETTAPHVHVEITAPDGTLVNPYQSLRQAEHIPAPVTYPALSNETLPFGSPYIGDINVTMGNFDADNKSEVLTGAGAGGGPRVTVFDDDNVPTGHDFFAYDPAFPGGVDVAAGDVDGDGVDEIITGAGAGGGPHVKIFRLDGTLIGGFYAYPAGFSGGVHVASADMDGDGKAEIITGAGAGGGPHVRVLKPTGVEVTGFYAYDPGYLGGVDVTAGNITSTSTPEIVAGAGPGGGPQVRTFKADGTNIGGFYAYGADFSGGVRVSVDNVRTSSTLDEILTAPDSFGGPHIREFDAEGAVLDQNFFLEQWWGGSYDVAAGSGTSRAAAGGNRRATIRATGLRQGGGNATPTPSPSPSVSPLPPTF